MSAISQKKLKDFVIKLRKKHQAIEDKIQFCVLHNFKLEAESKRNEAELLRKTIHEIEHEFDLGFVWDKSLND